MIRAVLPAVASVGILAASVLVATPAWAAENDSPDITAGNPVTRAEGFFTPLSLEIDRGQTAYLSQNFIGQLTRVARDGTVTSVASAPEGYEIGAVSSRKGVLYYYEGDQAQGIGTLKKLPEGGTPSQLADLWAYEAAHNPDQVETYGWVDLPADCAAQIDPTVFGPPTYTGTIDSHPYASLALNNGVFVADAGANAILKVGYDGTVSTVAVLPAQPPVTVTAEAATANGFPACVAGFDYRFESVPTDVEIGPKGQLYVSTLPGGPEDPSLGGRGSVYTVNPKTGESALLATGFVGATGLGVSTTTGTVVVSELFGGPDGTGQISVIEPGETQAKPLISLPSPSAIELRESRLWVTTDSFVLGPDGPQPIGKLTFLRLTHSDGTTSLLEDSTTEGD